MSIQYHVGCSCTLPEGDKSRCHSLQLLSNLKGKIWKLHLTKAFCIRDARDQAYNRVLTLAFELNIELQYLSEMLSNRISYESNVAANLRRLLKTKKHLLQYVPKGT